MLASSGSNLPLVIVSGVATTWLLTVIAAIPLVRDWRKSHHLERRDAALIRDEVLGSEPRDGLPGRPGMSVLVRQMAADLAQSVQGSADTTKTLANHEQRLDTHDRELARMSGLVEGRRRGHKESDDQT